MTLTLLFTMSQVSELVHLRQLQKRNDNILPTIATYEQTRGVDLPLVVAFLKQYIVIYLSFSSAGGVL